MQYQNKTPEEIVRQYKKKLRAKQGLLILIFLLYVIVGIRGIWWGDDGIVFERVQTGVKKPGLLYLSRDIRTVYHKSDR